MTMWWLLVMASIAGHVSSSITPRCPRPITTGAALAGTGSGTRCTGGALHAASRSRLLRTTLRHRGEADQACIRRDLVAVEVGVREDQIVLVPERDHRHVLGHDALDLGVDRLAL